MIVPARAGWRGAAAVLLLGAALAIGWPGVATFDSVVQYRQVLGGAVDDWHPPAMVRMWQALHPLADGAVPMFVLQEALYWIGLGLLGAALGQIERPRAGWGVLALGAVPLFAGWQAVVVKDCQMVAAMIGAVGLVGWWRLRAQPIPGWGWGLIAVLLGYALLLRANAVFAVVPLGVMLVPMRPWRRLAATGVGVALAILIVAPINRFVLAAAPTAVARSLPAYDLVGIAHFGGDDALPPAERALVAARHCYQPYFWDPIGSQAQCMPIFVRIERAASGDVARQWLGAVARHPIAYARHRLAHWNMTERWIVPSGVINAQPPSTSEPNDRGLSSPGASARWLAVAAGWVAASPIGWPMFWLVIAAGVAIDAARRPASPSRDLALALAVSALALEASFGVISIAADLRYHLWPILAAGLAAILRADAPLRRWIGTGVAVLVVVAFGSVARLSLPPAPDTYAATLMQ